MVQHYPRIPGPNARIGEVRVGPFWGRWPTPGSYPDWIQFEDRLLQRMTFWALPYAGVVAQYRAPVDRWSLHLLVFEDGSWTADHLDEDNPARGRPLQHLLNDVPVGRAIRDAIPYVAAGLAAGVLVGVVANALRRAA
jgi:hypothetical protein